MGRTKKYKTNEEKIDADRRDKRKCYNKHKELYNLISKRAYYNKCLKLYPDKIEYYLRLINESNTEIERIKSNSSVIQEQNQ